MSKFYVQITQLFLIRELKISLAAQYKTTDSFNPIRVDIQQKNSETFYNSDSLIIYFLHPVTQLKECADNS